MYEYSCLSFLKNNLNCKNMVRIGGANDKGLDLVGKWNLKPYYDALTNIPKTFPLTTLVSKSVEHSKKGALSLENNVNILVQCKHYSKKIKPNLVRELSGTYSFHVSSRNSSKNNILFLMALTSFTDEALKAFDTFSFPAVFLRVQPMVNNDLNTIFNIDSWDRGCLQSFHMNHKARSLLKGLNLELHLSVLAKRTASTQNILLTFHRGMGMSTE